MKNKKNFSFSIFVGILMAAGLFLMLGSQRAVAAADDALCKSYNVNFSCTDTATLASTIGCQKNKCLGQFASNVNVQCCPIDAPLKSAVGVAQTSNSSANGTSFVNPLRFTNVEGFLGGILSAIQKIIVVLALVFIMIGAVMILVSAGNSKMVENGKSAITMALIGLALGVAAPSLLKELGNIIGWIPRCNPGDVSCEALNKSLTLSQISVNVLNFLLGTMGILALIMMIIGAIMYLTSAGDDHRIEKGKEIFKYSVIGVIMAMASMVLVTQVARFFQ